jgi:hypothetical protein
MARRSLPIPVLCLGAALLAPFSAWAADVEVRDFVIWVDGKRAGEYHMTINRDNDGSVVMSGQADVKVSVLLVKTYTYTYRGSESWSKDGQLTGLSSTCNDDGKQYTVTAASDTNGLRVKINGQEKLSRADVWLTTYWRLPLASQRNGAVPLLDADTGRDINAVLQYVGVSPVNFAGQAQNYARYRLTGGVQVELWYDATERLVRQEWIEDGHKSVLELVRLRR